MLQKAYWETGLTDSADPFHPAGKPCSTPASARPPWVPTCVIPRCLVGEDGLPRLPCAPIPPTQGQLVNQSLSYNDISVQQQTWHFKLAKTVWGGGWVATGSITALYSHWYDQQNWLQASSGGEMQTHFKTKLNYLSSKMGDAWKACLHCPCAVLNALCWEAFLYSLVQYTIWICFLLNLFTPPFNLCCYCWKNTANCIKQSCLVFSSCS